MAKPSKSHSAVMTAPNPDTPSHSPDHLPWPISLKDVSPIPRLYRIHRIDAFSWQAYVLDPSDPKGEMPIGKPDLFDIVSFKVKGFQRMEGQMEFLASKRQAALLAERKHDEARSK